MAFVDDFGKSLNKLGKPYQDRYGRFSGNTDVKAFIAKWAKINVVHLTDGTWTWDVVGQSNGFDAEIIIDLENTTTLRITSRPKSSDESVFWIWSSVIANSIIRAGQSGEYQAQVSTTANSDASGLFLVLVSNLIN